ncbi:MAG TPA: PH domain-containing protein [Candidatus Limnocylindrales bacterium]|nr:PH domain-containing protein [Candidatus Limnocylindrales bacterium]
MRYADTLLTEGEQVIMRTRQHWLALLSRARSGVGLWLLGILILVAIVVLNVQDRTIRDVLTLVAIVFLLLGLIIFLYRLWHWWAQDYMITNRRLLKVTGILNKRSGDSSLEKINDAILIQSVWGRMFNFGDLEILTAADMANDRYFMLNSPKEFKKTMLTAKHQLETEFQSGRPPTPPLRAADERYEQAPPPIQAAPPPPPPAAMTAAPVMPETPSAAVAPDVDESLEVTQTLARLADLRDQGAITPEEYEQKKDELLGRL